MLSKKLFFIIFVLLGSYFGSSQNKYEREYRIKKSQFPQKAMSYIKDKLKDAKHIRFYKETDSTKTSYEAKFKKDRTKYSVEFDTDGVLEDIELLIRSVDIPNDTFSKMEKYFENNFVKHRIQKIQQQYPVSENNAEVVVQNAFQNLLLPYIKYEVIVSGKNQDGFAQYEILFDSEGSFENIRKSLPPNYDHILY